MEPAEPTKAKFLPAALWYTMAIAAVCAVAVSIFGLRSFAGSNFVALGVALVVVALIARHDIRIYGTPIRVASKDILAFWGIIWLGVSGGVLIGIGGSVAACLAYKYDRRRSLLLVFSDVISNFAVGSAYVLISGYVSPAGSGRFHNEDPGILTAAVVLIAAGHYLISSTLNYVSLYPTDERRLWTDTHLMPALSYLITIAAAVTINYLFVQFGIEFGWVLLPIAVVGDVAYAIHNQMLASKVREISEASRIHLATVEALATAIDARDQMGIGHVRRTQIFAIGIGGLLGLAEAEVSALRTAALLHDIGKLAVPDHILNKQATLTHAEIEKTKIHASVGASILEKVAFDTPVVPTVKYHHENWDGSGYPEALKGENIPLTARILSVADAYDTLRSARPYRPAIARDEAKAILRGDAGTKFDPRLVKIFLDNADRFEAEVDRQGLGYKCDRGDARLSNLAVDGAPQNFVEQIKLANREAFTLYELAKEFSSSLNLSQTLHLFTDKIREFVHFDTCAVYLVDEKTGGAASAHVAGRHAAVFNGHIVTPGIGVTGQVLATRSVARSCDPWPDLQLLRSSLTTVYRSMISLPMLAEGKLIGAVSLYSTDIVGYGEEHLRLVETIGRIAADAIAKAQLHADVESHALTDPMTGLPNARNLQAQFDREVARAHRAGSTFQVLMLDLDGFKQVNDTFGHKAGDRMLFDVGQLIKGQLREYDFLARYAGDEFVAIVPDASVEAVAELSNRIERAVGGFSLQVGEETAEVGVSIGWATYPYSGEAFDQLLIVADKAMYAAKARRKRSERFSSIPMPTKPLEDEIPVMVDSDDIDTIVDVDEQHIYLSSIG